MSMAQPIFESINTLDAAEFAAWVEARERLGDPDRYELLSGRVVVSPPAGWPHGEIEAAVATLLGAHVRGHNLGRTFGSSQGFELPTGDVVEPDASFVSHARWDAAPSPVPGKFLRVVPDLVVEILSTSTASRDRGEKKAAYARAGVLEYWIVDERARNVTVFLRAGDRFDAGRTFGEAERFASAVLPGLDVAVGALF